MKKTLAIILSLALVICMMPAAAFAAETPAAPTITLSPSSDTYNGANQFPTVKLNGADITNTQYSTAWSKDGSPVDSPNGAGTYKLTVMTIAEPQTAVGEATYTIEKFDLSKVNILIDDMVGSAKTESSALLNAASFYYNGGKLSTTDKIVTMLKSKLTATAQQTSDSKTYDVKFTCSDTDNFTGAVPDDSFKVVKDIASATVKDVKGNVVTGTIVAGEYNGKAWTAENFFRLYDGDGKLIDTKYYDPKYDEIKKAGTYTVTIYGRGEYGGTTSVNIEITKRNSSNLTYTTVPDQTVDTYKNYEPVIRDTKLGTTLEKGTDYLIQSYDNVQAGGKGYINIALIGNYDGDLAIPFKLVDADYDISKMLAYNDDVDLSYKPLSQNGSAYTGSTQYISANIRVYKDYDAYKNKNAISSNAYSIVYEYDKYDADKKVTTKASTTAPKDANAYKVYVEGRGSYAGRLEIGTFTIPKYNMKNVTVTATVTSATSAPAVTVRGANGAYFEKDKDYTVSYYANTRRNTMSVTVTPKSDGNLTGTSFTRTYSITSIDISSYIVKLDKTSVDATGYSIVLPKVTEVYRGTAKLSSSDYAVSYQDADGKNKVTSIVTPGTYRVVVTGVNGYSGSTYATFTVVGLSQSITGVESSYKVYPNDTFVLSPKATEGRFTYSSSDPSVATVSSTGVVTAYKAGRAKITITTTGNTKYDQVSKSTVIKVYPKKAVITKKPWTNGKKAQLKVRWNKQENVTRYEIRYSRSKSFAKGTYLTKKVNAANNDYTTQSTTIKNLKSGYTYYVKVRAVKEVYNDYGKKITYYGKWSGWRSVKVK